MKIYHAGNPAGWEQIKGRKEVEFYIYNTFENFNRLHSFFYIKETLDCFKAIKELNENLSINISK